MPTSNIRNFCIISHVDHGKSTLADRFLELTNTISKGKMEPQYLDRMPLERERGITIKLQPATMIWCPPNHQIRNSKLETLNKSEIQNYKNQNKSLEIRNSKLEIEDSEYILNLIDTPGHVDFSYEVSRSLAAVEGALLLVDVRQGIQAQTLANLYLAQKQKLTLIPVINKIDLENINIDETKKELANLLSVNEEEILCISAKKGIGINDVLKTVVEKVPPPISSEARPPMEDGPQSFRALIFDSYFDEYKGVIVYVRIFDGNVSAGEKITFLASEATSEVQEVGIFSPDLKAKSALEAGEIGYIITGLKDIEKCRVGDTIAIINDQLSIQPLPGYTEPQHMVFAGLYPIAGTEQEKLRRALIKLKLNDASLVFEPLHSPALGFGFRAGFLGMLHMDIIRERIKREYGIEIIISSPSVAYRVFEKSDQDKYKIIHSPSDIPDSSTISRIDEPWMKVDIITPKAYIGAIMDLLSSIGGEKESKTKFISLEYIGDASKDTHQRALLHYSMPLSLLLTDFYDKVKSVSHGYGSYGYQFLDYQPADVIKLDILVAGEGVDQLSSIVYKEEAYAQARKIVTKLKQVLPRQLFEVKIQAVIGGRILASERISPLRKDVTANLYGGDVTRKRKLLEKQKKGKKKLVKFGKVNIPPEAYWAEMKR